MPADTIDTEALDALLNDLDTKAKQQHSGERSEDYWVCHRRHPRHPFRAGCMIRFFPQGAWAVAELPGRTRNLSRSGIGLLVRRVFSVQEPLEVEVLVPGKPNMYMAGLVTFCRYAGRGYHEVGVALRQAGSSRILPNDLSSAQQTVEWLRRDN